ncbi:MAG: phytoene desaturase family protein [Deferrisomatales bacterium]
MLFADRGPGPGTDALVVGSGPNGLAAAAALAREGLSVEVWEGHALLGGGCRSQELTLPGFLHDVCSAVHPMGLSSPFLRRLPLGTHGVEWVLPPVPLAHPLDDGTAAVLEHGADATAEKLGPDAAAWRRLMEPLAGAWLELAEDLLAPPIHRVRHPAALARFGLLALRSARGLAESRFRGPRARALFAGMAAHGVVPLERAGTAAFGLALGAAGQAVGWPLVRGGSQALAAGLADYVRGLGGIVRTGMPVRSWEDLPRVRSVLWDVTPRQLLALGGTRLPGSYRRALRGFRYGPGVFKVDWALSEPIPWTSSECRRAGTIHLGGTLEEIAACEKAVWRGRTPGKPYTILVQPTLFDPSRAPPGRHTAWAYCHVPSGSPEDLTGRIEAQVERFAPGFRECVLARSSLGPRELEAHNPNYVGGDIGGGVQDLRQTFARPVAGSAPYRTPVKGWYLCSSSTPPGGGVHGMCGFHAAAALLGDLGKPKGRWGAR